MIVRTLTRDQQTRPLARALADRWRKDPGSLYVRDGETMSGPDLALRYLIPELGLPCTVYDVGVLKAGTLVEVSASRALIRVQLDDGRAYVFMRASDGVYRHGPKHGKHPKPIRYVSTLGIAENMP